MGDELGAAKLCVVIARMIAATARTIPKTNASLAGSGFGAMCLLLAPDKCCHGALWRGELEGTYEPLHISLGHNRAPGQGQLDEPALPRQVTRCRATSGEANGARRGRACGRTASAGSRAERSGEGDATFSGLASPSPLAAMRRRERGLSRRRSAAQR